MDHLRKGIACLVILASMSTPQAKAAEWSYGIKIGGSNSFVVLSDRGKERLKGYYVSTLPRQLVAAPKPEVNPGRWNPWFAGALYMEYAFNEHIGLGTELLYSRLGLTIKGSAASELTSCSSTSTQFIHTIGKTLLLTWYWTGAIRPDFKDDYFLGRLFASLHAFYCMKRREKLERIVNGKKSPESTDGFKDKPFGGKKDRFQFGFIVGTSLEFPNGLLLEAKGLFPYNLDNIFNDLHSSFVTSIHLSVGYNFAKACN